MICVILAIGVFFLWAIAMLLWCYLPALVQEVRQLHLAIIAGRPAPPAPSSDCATEEGP